MKIAEHLVAPQLAAHSRGFLAISHGLAARAALANQNAVLFEPFPPTSTEHMIT
eukprot:SAG31_NODE_28804_length_405_cov_0.643791_1_plen_54_part_00